MKKFQLQLYQLSRLVKDHLPELYIWLDQNDVSPTLYAAPWILTVFSSQFPLGFVARVFDLLFLESSEVIFKFAIALLTVHKDELLARDNFEEIMDYLKTVVPKMEANTMEKIMKLVSLEKDSMLLDHSLFIHCFIVEILSLRFIYIGSLNLLQNYCYKNIVLNPTFAQGFGINFNTNFNFGLLQVFTLDVSKQLIEYNVEYNVLQEEISTANHHLEMLNREKTRNMHLEQQLQVCNSSFSQKKFGISPFDFLYH